MWSTLPTEKEIDGSRTKHSDSFFKLPREIECFIARANQELKNGYYVKPWTINQAVTVFDRQGHPVLILSYENILNDLVWWLDMIQRETQKDEEESNG